MKRFFIILAIAIIAIVAPVTLVACDSNKSPSEIANTYSTIQTNSQAYFDSTTREFKVVFSSAVINSNMNNSSSNIYSLGKVYMPMLNASMGFVNSKATTFKACLEKFSKDELSRIYSTMKTFGKELSEFAIVKKTFDQANQVNGTGYPAMVTAMNGLIDSAIDFNLAFYNAYYSKIYVKERNYKKEGFTFTKEDKTVEVLGNKLYIANVLNEHYLKAYHWTRTNGSGNIVTFLGYEQCVYFKDMIDILKNNNVSTYSSAADDPSLIALRENHSTFIKEMDRAIKNMADFNYSDYYNSTAKTSYFEDLPSKTKDTYYAVENFMESRLKPLYYATAGLMN